MEGERRDAKEIARCADGAYPANLTELLTGIIPENVHGEWATGPPAGAELL